MLWSAVPPDVAGIPTWILNGLSIGTLVMMIVGGLASSRLWTKSQVDKLEARYEKHLERTIENMQGRIDDAVRREGEWRDVAMQFKEAFQLVEGVIEPVQFQSQTMLTILRQIQQLQREGQPDERG